MGYTFSCTNSYPAFVHLTLSPLLTNTTSILLAHLVYTFFMQASHVQLVMLGLWVAVGHTKAVWRYADIQDHGAQSVTPPGAALMLVLSADS